MYVWIFQSGEPLHSDKDNYRPMRCMNLANTLVKRGHSVLLLSSSFFHQKKYHRSKNYKEIKINKSLKILLIPSPGYKKNLSISRLFDHFVLAFNLARILKLQTKFPDVAFIGYPPIETAYVLVKWLKKKKIPNLLDVKDQWPQIFIDAVPKLLRPFAYIFFFPYFLVSKKIMHQSTGISSISESFLKASLKFSGRQKNKFDIVSPLTSPIDNYLPIKDTEVLNWWHKREVYNNDVFKVIFVGSFSKVFDFDAIFYAASEILKKKINCEFILCGDGEMSKYLKKKSKNYKNVKIFDWIDKEKIISLAKISSAFIAPYKNNSDFVKSIPNKVIDSLKFGLPLLSPLKGEVRNLINNYKVGISYSDEKSLLIAIKKLMSDELICKLYSNNSIKLYKKNFEFNRVYNQLVDNLENLNNKNE